MCYAPLPLRNSEGLTQIDLARLLLRSSNAYSAQDIMFRASGAGYLYLVQDKTTKGVGSHRYRPICGT